MYVFKTLKTLRAELGDELADDLAKRHLEQDPHMTGKYVQKLLGSHKYMYIWMCAAACMRSCTELDVSERLLGTRTFRTMRIPVQHI